MKTILALCSLALGAAPQETIVETAIDAGNLETFFSLIGSTDLGEALSGEGPFTVFAPTDAAFAKLPKETLAKITGPGNRAFLQDLLTYHVISGDVGSKSVRKANSVTTLNGQRAGIAVDEDIVTIGGATLTTTDIKCSNGVIHLIDAVMMPETKTIMEVAAGAGSFGSLIAAAKAAGLVETLSGGGPITVFAPTDEAFAALPGGTLAELLRPKNKERLAGILRYHIVPGRVFADQAARLDKAPTLNGKDVTLSIDEDGAKVGDANLVKTDIQASNGVIHVVDAVILP